MLKRIETAGIFTLRLATATYYRPPAGKAWLILGGCVAHINGTDTLFRVIDLSENRSILSSRILSAETSGTYSIFNNDEGTHQAQWTPLIFTSEHKLYLTGGSGCVGEIQLLEWTV